MLAAVECRAEGQQLVEGQAQGVDVGALVDHPAAGQGLLGAHVAEGAHQVAAPRQAGIAAEPGQAEVRDPELALRIDHEIGGLDVAVDHAQRMRVVERLGRLDAQPGDRTKVRPGETSRPCVIADRIDPLGSVQMAYRAANQRDGRGKASRPGGVADEPGIHAVGPRAGELLGVPTHLAHELRQAPPVDELHGVEMDPPVAAGREHRHDVGMVELGRGLGLDQEPLPLPGIDRGGEGEYLERDPAAEGDLLGLVHHAHAAAADFPVDTIFAQPGGHEHARPARPAG